MKITSSGTLNSKSCDNTNSTLLVNNSVSSSYNLILANRINIIGADLSYGLDISINVNTSSGAFNKTLSVTITNYINSTQDTSNSYVSGSSFSYAFTSTNAFSRLISLRKIRPQPNGVYLPMTINANVSISPFTGILKIQQTISNSNSNSNIYVDTYSVGLNTTTFHNLVLPTDLSHSFAISNASSSTVSYTIHIKQTNNVDITQTQWTNTFFLFPSSNEAISTKVNTLTNGMGSITIQPLVSSGPINISFYTELTFTGTIVIHTSDNILIRSSIDNYYTDNYYDSATNTVSFVTTDVINVTIRVYNISDFSWNSLSFSSSQATITDKSATLSTNTPPRFGTFRVNPLINSGTIDISSVTMTMTTFTGDIRISPVSNGIYCYLNSVSTNTETISDNNQITISTSGKSIATIYYRLMTANNLTQAQNEWDTIIFTHNPNETNFTKQTNVEYNSKYYGVLIIVPLIAAGTISITTNIII